jgi:LSD1 subclass zinc finger protein
VPCVACNQPVQLPHGAALVVCACGKEYQAMTGQPVDDPICELPGHLVSTLDG